MSSKTADQTSSSSSLKRKRPPSIDIPNVLREIGADHRRVFTPKPNAHSFSIEGVALSSVKGKKKFMEDSHKIVPFLQGNLNKAFFGVYDGHGGSKAAEFVAENLHRNIVEMTDNCTDCSEKEERVKSAYLKTDLDFLNLGVGSGACCVTALIQGEEVVVSNLGDCRAVLSRSGVAEAVTKDHRAEREDERKRIESKGGYVEFHRGAWRVHGILSVSRSIGDGHLKKWVPAEPETTILRLTQDMEFLVLASDGLWEEVSNQEAIDIVSRVCMRDQSQQNLDHNQQNFDQNHDGCAVNLSPSSKLRRICIKRHSPLYKKTKTWRKDGRDDEYSCENQSPALKSRRISMAENRPPISNGDGDEYSCENQSPALKSRRISMAEKRPPISNGGGDEYSCENQSPALKSRRTSMAENRPPSSNGGGLVAACKELVDLALGRGSLDDITVTVIDLHHFRCI